VGAFLDHDLKIQETSCLFIRNYSVKIPSGVNFSLELLLDVWIGNNEEHRGSDTSRSSITSSYTAS
jgi:hypothetical protein